MTQEALKLALEALDDKVINKYKVVKAITAIKEALAQPEQEPKIIYDDFCERCSKRPS